MRKNVFIIRIFFVICFLASKYMGFSQNGIVKGKIRNDVEILTSATVSLGNQTTLSDLKGEFVFSIKPGKYVLAITYAGYQKVKKEITVTAGSLYDLELVLQPTDKMTNVTVLGSRSLKERSNLTTPVPIDVIQFSKLPARQIELTRIIENTIPSFTAAAQGFREGKQTVPVSLRGLGPDHTLVLMNGKRLHTTASPWTFGVIGFGTVGVDMNAIPSAAIETVEVLRDGASAQYGSDAIGGVIDMQLKRSTGITSVQFHIGQYYKGDGEAISLSINHGIAFLKKGFLNFTAQARFNNHTQRNGTYDSSVYYRIPPGLTIGQKDSIRLLDNTKITERGFDRNEHRPIGDNKVWNSGFVINGGYPLSSKTYINWTAVWNYRSSKDISSNAYRYPRDSATLVNVQLYPDGFLPYINSKIPDISLASAINGITSSGWRWDAGIMYGKNSNTVNVSNSNNASQYLLGKNAQTRFYTGKQLFSQLTNNVNFSREFLNAMNWMRSLNIAFGAEFRLENYRIKEGEEASWKNYLPTSGRFGGSQGQAGFQPTNAINKYREVLGSYVEFEMEPTKYLLLNFAGRYEYYSDYGNNIVGKIAFRYKIFEHISWRGSISNGFRAPALQQKFYSLITTTTRPGGIILKTVTFPNNSEAAQAFGISGLNAEKSINLSTGFTLRLLKNVSATIDAYWVQIKDRIIYSGNIPDTISEVRNILNSLGLTDVQNVRFFSNAVSTRTKGIDVVITSQLPINKSKLEISLAANFNETTIYDITQYAKNLSINEKYKNLLVNREERCRIEDAYPKDKILLNINYSNNKWKFNASFTRYGKVIQKANDPKQFPDEVFSPKIISAMNLCYHITSGILLTVGAENIADIYPDKLKYPSNTQNWLLPYNPNFAPFGINGGYYFVNMSFNFRRNKKSHL